MGNLEGPIAPGILRGGHQGQDPGWAYDGRVYSGTDMIFNYHQYLAEYRGAIGIDLTIQNLKKYKLDYVGTRTHDEALQGKVVRVEGLKKTRAGAIVNQGCQ